MSRRSMPPPPPQLYPIRIDVTASPSDPQRHFRIVDTLLVDPHVLSAGHGGGCGGDNGGGDGGRIAQLAYAIVADAAVQGVGRSARHFTGRIHWDADVVAALTTPVTQQIQEQLRAVHELLRPTTTTRMFPPAHRAPKRQRRNEDTTTTAITTIPSIGNIAETETESPIQLDSIACGVMDEKSEEASAQGKSIRRSRCRNGNSGSGSSGSNGSNNIIPIRLRLSVHGIRIHDDFDWDLALMDTVSCLQMAQAMGNDLNLPPEAVQAIAVDMAEQVVVAATKHHHHQNHSDEEPEKDDGSSSTTSTSTAEDDDGGPAHRRNVTAAWELPPTVHVTNVAHLVANHRRRGSHNNNSNSSNNHNVSTTTTTMTTTKE